LVEDSKCHEKVYLSTALFHTNFNGPEFSVTGPLIEEKPRYRMKWFPASHHRRVAAA
jgi:hypothetical protein